MTKHKARMDIKSGKYTWHSLKNLLDERAKDSGMSRLNPNMPLSFVLDIMFKAIKKFEPNSFPNCDKGTEAIQATNILRECL